MREPACFDVTAWWDAGARVVIAGDREAAALLGAADPETVRGPYPSRAALAAARRLSAALRESQRMDARAIRSGARPGRDDVEVNAGGCRSSER